MLEELIAGKSTEGEASGLHGPDEYDRRLGIISDITLPGYPYFTRLYGVDRGKRLLSEAIS